jgi:hypothetical protein
VMQSNSFNTLVQVAMAIYIVVLSLYYRLHSPSSEEPAEPSGQAQTA